MKMLYKLHLMGVRLVFVGDSKQLPSIDDRLLRYSDFGFFKEMVQTKVELTVNHRFDGDMDKLAMRVYNEGCFDWDRVKETELNISYYDKNGRQTRKKVNQKFSDNNKGKAGAIQGHGGYWYVVGSPVICNVNKKGLQNNRTFRVDSIGEAGVVVKEGEDMVSSIVRSSTSIWRWLTVSRRTRAKEARWKERSVFTTSSVCQERCSTPP